jgi:inhibitor of cysteine peptidase
MRIPALAIYFDRRKLASYMVLAFVLGGLLGGAMWNIGGIYIPESPALHSGALDALSRFTSYEELKGFINTHETGYWYAEEDLSSVNKAATAAQAAKAASQGALDFSGTNVQVEGVDEADIIKTDGRYIYMATEDTVVIVRAYPPEEAEVVARLRLYQWVSDLFINGDKLAVFLTLSRQVYYDVLGCEPPPELDIETTVQVYDISDRSSPELEREVTVEGAYFNSRMIGDYVYAVVRKGAWLERDEVSLPSFSSEKSWWEVDPTDIYYVNQSDAGFVFTNILAFNVQDPEEEFSSETFLLGVGTALYVSLENIYIAAGSWDEDTSVYKIGIQGGEVSYVAEGRVPGRVLNQFSMDEHDGNFRIATTQGHVSRSGGGTGNNVYVLNSTLGIIGSLEGLAPGEQIHSARFMGERCYLVTFKKVDPLFVIDLSNPSEPEVLGKLKIPGYSDYLHPYDENTLIGFGKETEEAEMGDFAWYQGIKISLFDVSDVSSPRELAKLVIGDRGSDSPALDDHKAFLFSWARNLLVVPILVAEVDPERFAGPVPANTHGEYVFQGAYVLDISPESGISVRGRVTHLDERDDLLKSGYWFESAYEVRRSLYIEDVLYTISGRMIKMNSLVDLSEMGKVDIS